MIFKVDGFQLKSPMWGFFYAAILRSTSQSVGKFPICHEQFKCDTKDYVKSEFFETSYSKGFQRNKKSQKKSGTGIENITREKLKRKHEQENNKTGI